MDSQESNKKVKRGLELPNYTQIPNIFLDEYMRELSSSGMKVFLVICRKTLGFQKFTDSIAISQIMDMTGLSNRVSIQAIKELEEYGVIIKTRSGSINKYTLNIKQSDEKSQAELRNVTLQSDEKSHTKETNKETLNKIESNGSNFNIFEEIEKTGNKLKTDKYGFKLTEQDKTDINTSIAKHGKDKTIEVIEAYFETRTKSKAGDLKFLFDDNWKLFKTLLGNLKVIEASFKQVQSCPICHIQFVNGKCPECGLSENYSDDDRKQKIDELFHSPEDEEAIKQMIEERKRKLA